MRIYAVADIHAKKNRIDEIKFIINRYSPDLLIIAGDITNYFFPSRTIDQLKDIPIPFFCIRGNSDFQIAENQIKKLSNGTLLDTVPLQMGKYQFLGINGTIPLPFLSKLKWNETHHLNQFKQTITRHTILVAHAPPRGICDKVANRYSAGSFQFKNLIENHPPLLVLCGHVHEQAGYGYLNSTPIINCAMNKIYAGAIIECDINQKIEIKMIERSDNQTNHGR